MTLYEEADRLALKLEVNADAHQETPGTERRRAAAMIRGLLNEIDRVRALDPKEMREVLLDDEQRTTTLLRQAVGTR